MQAKSLDWNGQKFLVLGLLGRVGIRYWVFGAGCSVLGFGYGRERKKTYLKRKHPMASRAPFTVYPAPRTEHRTPSTVYRLPFIHISFPISLRGILF